jgi:hypothetical protein
MNKNPYKIENDEPPIFMDKFGEIAFHIIYY